ncbi:hypothetical protein HDU96_006508 [Phlyctochytrium bullatum]|nr:hypothetical protein HDU96_006508 [Phlyctochytrium bullatum]
MQQSVLDELENLDIDGAIKKKVTYDDDFDYVYHLPHADLTRLGPRRYDPFAKLIEKANNSGIATATAKKQPVITIPTLVATDGSPGSIHSRKMAAKILDLDGTSSITQQHKQRRGSHHLSTNGGSYMNLAGSNLGIPGNGTINRSRRPSSMGGSNMGLNVSMAGGSHANLAGSESRQGSVKDALAMVHVPGGGTSERRLSVGSHYSRKIHPSDVPSVDYADRFNGQGEKGGRSSLGAAAGGSLQTPNNAGEFLVPAMDDDDDDGKPSFKAIPPWLARYIRPKTAAIICFILTFGMAVLVVVYDFVLLATGQNIV